MFCPRYRRHSAITIYTIMYIRMCIYSPDSVVDPYRWHNILVPEKLQQFFFRILWDEHGHLVPLPAIST